MSITVSQCTYRCVALPDRLTTRAGLFRSSCLNEPFSPEPMAQGPGSARWCGKDGCGAGVARTGAAHLVLPRTFQHHHADPGQSGDLPGEKGSVIYREVWGG